MDQDLAVKAQFIGLVAQEAAEESDAIERHPEVIDVLAELSGREGLRELFGANGHDPVAFIDALVAGLEPYRTESLGDEAPELVFGLGLVAQTLVQQSGVNAIA